MGTSQDGCNPSVHFLKASLFVLIVVMLVVTASFMMDHKISKPSIILQDRRSRKLVVKNASNAIHIATNICGDRLEEGTTMLKSAFIFSRTHLVFHVFTEDKLRKPIENEVNSWSRNQSRLNIIFYSVQYPFPKSCPTCTYKIWNSLFGPCAAQRLFFPAVMTKVDSVIYLDSDMLFLSPVEDVWTIFKQFSPSQFAGLSPELSGWYADKKFPYCTPTGLNSGLFLMNLTKMRASDWMEKIIDYYTEYREQLKLWDQDLINLYCHFHQDQFHIIPCSFNYRGIFCPTDKACNMTESTGVSILHGNSRAFHLDIFPAEKAIYNTVKEYDPNNSSLFDLYNLMKTNIEKHSSTECGKRQHLFLRNVEKYYLTKQQAGDYDQRREGK